MALQALKNNDDCSLDHWARERNAEDIRITMKEYLDSNKPLKSPSEGGKVFVDRNMFPNNVALERVRRAYQCEHLNIVWLSKSSLDSQSLSRYPRIDHLFRVRGFVSQIDVDRFKSGQSAQTQYLARNRAAACAYYRILSLLFEGREKPRESVGMDVPISYYMGYKNHHPVPLVARGGLLLPLEKASSEDQVHDAYYVKPEPALKLAETDEFGIISAVEGEIRDQVVWEKQHSATVHAGSTSRALLLWQTQALAYLRKAAWDIEFEQGAQLNRQEIKAWPKNKRIAEQVRDGKTELDAHRTLINHRKASQMKLRKQHLNDDPEKFKFDDTFEELQVTVAALHGATYQPDFSFYEERNPYSHRLRSMLPAAQWIGDLKRKRVAVLTKSMVKVIAHILHSFDFDDERRGSANGAHADWLRDRFAEIVWDQIGEAAKRLREEDNDEAAISIVYDWTSDAVKPWGAEWKGDILKITGPLLDFPISKASEWNDKAMALQS